MKAWKITKDLMAEAYSDQNHTGTWGNFYGTCLIRDGKVKGVTQKGESVCPDVPMPVKFRITDDDGEVYYHGEMTAELADSYDVLRPLDDFATPNDGATTMEFMKDGKWEAINS